MATGLAAYGVIGSAANFLGFTRWSQEVAWAFALLMTASAAFGVIGVASLLVALRYDQPPPWARRLVNRTPLTVVPHTGPREAIVDVLTDRVRPLGPHHVTDRVAAAARVVAICWSVAAALAFTFLAAKGFMPQAPGGSTIEAGVAGPVQLALLSVFGVGTLLTTRREAVGATVMAVAGSAMAIVASIQYPPLVAVGVSLVFLVPAFLHWVAWQRDKRAVHVLRLLVVTAVLVGGVWLGADRVYAQYFGPTHPETTAPALAPSSVEWIWAGGTSPHETTVVAKLRNAHDRVRVALALTGDMAEPRFSAELHAGNTNHQVVRATFDTLRPDTTYHYAVEADGQLDLVRAGTVHTFPNGPAGFTVAFGSCARTGSNGAVFDAIRAEQPLAYLSLGDLHYANIERNDEDAFRAALDRSLASTSQGGLYRSTTVGYVWDDHDFAGNNANETAATRPAAEAVYRQYVPHYALPGGEGSGPIYQAFTIGRARFLLTDNRSTRTPQTAVDDASKFMLGPGQERWLIEELAAARGRDGIVVWVNANPWIGAPSPQADEWAGYTAQRSRIAEVIASYGLASRLVMLSGDAHMVAIDDGTNSDYSSTRAGGFPVMQAAPLDRPPGEKGGPYTDGPFTGAGQYGVLNVQDNGGNTITVRLVGRAWDHRTLVDRSFTLQAGGP